MNRYLVTYIEHSTQDAVCVWVNAKDEDDAIEETFARYTDVDEVVDVS